MSSDYVQVNHELRLMTGGEVAGLMAAVLEKKVPFRFTASGFSMAPFIRNGDVITLKPLPARLCRGDVVAFIEPCCGKLMVHRIIHVSVAGYLMKGDNNSEPDGRIPPSSLIGLVVRVEHLGRLVRLGGGRERAAIAWLSRRGWLIPFVVSVWRFLKPVAGKWIA